MLSTFFVIKVLVLHLIYLAWVFFVLKKVDPIARERLSRTGKAKITLSVTSSWGAESGSRSKQMAVRLVHFLFLCITLVAPFLIGFVLIDVM